MDTLTTSPTVAAVMFKWQKDGKTYDYLVPAGMKVAVGDKVVVATQRGETTVEVMALKTSSDLAQKEILRVVVREAVGAEAGARP